MATIPTAAPPAGTHQNNNQALTVLTSLFFMMGFITCMNDILVPHLKEVFSLNYAQALLVQFCFFTAYAITSIPFGKFISRLGYKNGVIGGFLIAATGCLLFYPAAGSKSYPIFLGALFILSTEIISADQQKAMSAADLAKYQAGQAASVQEPYLILAGILILLAVSVFFIRLPAAEKIAQEVSAHAHDDRSSAWHYHHLKLGTVGIFCYVGAEVAIGSLLVSVMGLPEVAGLKEATAAHYLTYYWGGAMVGRFLGSYLLNIIRPGIYLSFNALMNVLLISLAIAQGGHVAMYCLLACGFFNSIMFPTIFSLATRGLGRHTSQASGMLATAIVGGAIVPLFQGVVADTVGLLPSFWVAAACYCYIVYFGLFGHRVKD